MRPSPSQAAAALHAAQSGRISLAERVAAPPLFFVPIGAAVAVQIGTTAAGVAGWGGSPGSLILAGFAVLLLVAALQLVRFRDLNGVWLGGLVSRVVGGTATTASTSYIAGLGGALWAALSGAWWLVLLCAVAGGAGYAWSGRRWMDTYRAEPATRGRGEPLWLVAALGVLFASGATVLVALR